MLETIFRYREQGRFHLHAFVVMPEHLHVLLTPVSGQTVERCAQCIKGGFSFAVRHQFPGEIWQAGFHEHRIRDQGDFAHHLGYIARNPERRGLNDYPYMHSRYPGKLDPIPAHLQKS